MEMNPKLKNGLEWAYCIIIAIVLALLFRYYIGTPTVVKQPSMYNTLEDGQRLLLSRWTRTVNGKYERGDIITFEAPSITNVKQGEIDMNNPVAIYNYQPTGIASFVYNILELNKMSYIKRVIGVENDHIQIKDGAVYVNENKLPEEYLQDGVVTDANKGIFTDLIVPENCVFALGDNRTRSTDSRNFGCIPIEKIEGKVIVRFWPLNLFGKVE